MKLTINEGIIRVKLSRRNLETLLNKLNRNREPTATPSRCELIRYTEADVWLQVKAEENEVHYADREAGDVHPLDDPDLSEAA